MHVAVLGPGGVGGLLAALLARQGAKVTCIASDSTVSRIRQQGLALRSERFGSFVVSVESESELSQPADVLLVTVKAVDLGAALARVPSGLIAEGVVVPFLNGIDHMQVLRDHFTHSRVVAGTIRVESTRTAAGEIHHASPFALIEVAPAGAMPEPLREICEVFVAAGVDVHVRSDADAMLWGKLSFLAPLALLTSVHSAPAGAIRTAHRKELLQVVDEVAAVARAEGVDVHERDVVALLDAVPETMQSSMQRDLVAGRPMEIEAIGGTVVRHARAHAIDVPELNRIVADLRARSALA